MITRAEAIAIYQGYQSGFSKRVEAQIRNAAASGVNISVTPLVISYGGVSNATAAAVATELQAAPNNWTVVNDNVGKTLTVS